MALTTGTLGIFQSDLIIISALKAAFADLRNKPKLIEYAFASLPADALTAAEYGQKDVNAAKAWFLQNEIDVRLNVKGEPPHFPCVTVALLDSTEANENTLADIDAEVFEEDDSEWPTLAGPFTPTYVPGTGVVTLPVSVVGAPLFEGAVLVDKKGNQYPIIEVLDDRSFTIALNKVVDFTDASLRAPRPALLTLLESASFRETYSLGVHAAGEPIHTIILHSIVVFCLLRYRQTLLEARGYERTSISSSDLRRNDQVEVTENIYSRFLSVQGYVRHWWPKATSIKPVGVLFQPRIVGVSKLASDGTGPADPPHAPWVGTDDVDQLGGKP